DAPAAFVQLRTGSPARSHFTQWRCDARRMARQQRANETGRRGNGPTHHRSTCNALIASGASKRRVMTDSVYSQAASLLKVSAAMALALLLAACAGSPYQSEPAPRPAPPVPDSPREPVIKPPPAPAPSAPQPP